MVFGWNGGRNSRGSSSDRQDLTVQKNSGQPLSRIPLKTCGVGQRKWNQSNSVMPLHLSWKRTHDKLELYWWVNYIWIDIQLSNISLVLHCEEHSNPLTGFDLPEVDKLSSFYDLPTNSRLSRYHKPNGIKLNYTHQNTPWRELLTVNVDFSVIKH